MRLISPSTNPWVNSILIRVQIVPLPSCPHPIFDLILNTLLPRSVQAIGWNVGSGKGSRLILRFFNLPHVHKWQHVKSNFVKLHQIENRQATYRSKFVHLFESSSKDFSNQWTVRNDNFNLDFVRKKFNFPIDFFS